MKTIKQFSSLLFFLCCFYNMATAQVITSFADVENCSLDTVHLPITISTLDSIGSISLVFSMDTAKADFISLGGFHEKFSQVGWTGQNFIGTEVLFLWYTASSDLGAAFGMGDTLFEVVYMPKTYDAVSFTWDTIHLGRCAYSDNYGAPLVATYESDSIHLLGNGTAQPISPPHLAQGISTTVNFNWHSTTCDLTYVLEISENSDFSQPFFAFTGLVDTFLNNVSGLQPNTTYYWRVARVGEAGVPIYSETFVFNTNTTSNNYVLNEDDLSIFPNPVSDFLNISIKNTNYRISSFKIINALGQVFHRKEINKHELDVSNLQAGVYQLLIELDNGKIITKMFVKN